MKRPQTYWYPPGDILFSAVTGGPSHVHSPQEFEYRVDELFTVNRDNSTPVSLSNSLLDPNIELPTITVREVDAVLSNITTSTISSSPKVLSNNDGDSQCRPSLTASDIISTRTYATLPNDSVMHGFEIAKSESNHNCIVRQAHVLKNTQQTFTPPLMEPHTAHPTVCVDRNENDIYTTGDVRFPKGADCPHASVLTSQGKYFHWVKLISRSSESATQHCNGACNPQESKKLSNSIHPESQRFYYLTAPENDASTFCLLPIQRLSSQHSSVGILDLATDVPLTDVSVSFTSEAEKCRQANLCVRMANQNHLSKVHLVTYTHKKMNNMSCMNHDSIQNLNPTVQNHLPKQELQSDLPVPMTYAPHNTFERFKYICPHPRCGRKYKAEHSLLRHLSKYHEDTIAESRSRRPVNQSQINRRPASEERSREMREFANLPPKVTSLRQSSSGSFDDFLSCQQTVLSGTKAASLFLESDTSTSDGRFSTLSLGSVSESDCPSQSPRENIIGYTRASSHTENVCNVAACCTSGQLSNSLSPNILFEHAHKGTESISIPSFTEDVVTTLAEITISSTPSSRTRMSSSGASPTTNAFMSRPSRAISEQQCEPEWESSVEPVRRRTLSSGAEPHNTTHSSNPLSNEQSDCCSTCPRCGSETSKSDEKNREWISGVRALTYSKTDSIFCPMDGCSHVCQGRAELSAHLTNHHFPEVQNQLVRLIFACPVKDCHMVCANEKNFQTHFNRHLFGYLPGDIAGLFSAAPSSVHVCAPDTTTGTVPEPTSIYSSPPIPYLSNCEDQLLTEDPATQTTLTASDAKSLRVSLNAMKQSDPSRYDVPRFLLDDLATSDAIEHSSNDDVVLDVKPPNRAVTLPDMSADPLSLADYGINVDLDHRNLVFALDLIPDDLLTELLKEDRPGLWGDGVVNSGSGGGYSAPASWDSRQSTDKNGDTETPLPCPLVSGGSGFAPNTNSHDSVSVQSDEVPSNTLQSGCNSWVPLPVVHQTWSMAVASERSCGRDSTNENCYVNTVRECPRHVLSDLTAALILPDFERCLKASANSLQSPRKPNYTPTTSSSNPFSADSGRCGRQNINSCGKRRRNVSESSPNSSQNLHPTRRTTPLVLRVNEVNNTRTNASTVTVNRFNQPAPVGLVHSPAVPNGHSSGRDTTPGTLPPNSTHYISKPISNLNQTTFGPLLNDLANCRANQQLTPFTPTATTAPEPHSVSEPKKRRRKIIKAMAVTSPAISLDGRGYTPLIDVSQQVPTSTNKLLPRRHSMICYNIVLPTHAPR